MKILSVGDKICDVWESESIMTIVDITTDTDKCITYVTYTHKIILAEERVRIYTDRVNMDRFIKWCYDLCEDGYILKKSLAK